MNTFEEVVEAKGHLIDSGIMSQILDRVIEHKCTFEIEKFLVGKTNDDYSLARIKIQSHSSESLKELLDILVPLGCYLAEEQDARIEPALGSGRVPDDFYSSTNYRTYVRLVDGQVSWRGQKLPRAAVEISSGGSVILRLSDGKHSIFGNGSLSKRLSKGKGMAESIQLPKYSYVGTGLPLEVDVSMIFGRPSFPR